jgi:signal transduction histidine kinase
MTLQTFLSDLTQILYLAIFVAAVVVAVQRPRRVNVDVALLFGATTILIGTGFIGSALGIVPGHLLTAFEQSLLMALPYLLLRLVNDYVGVPAGLMRLAEGGLALAVLGVFALSALPIWLTLLYVLYFGIIEVYAAVCFIRQGITSAGVPRQRMRAAALGSLFLGLVIVFDGLQAAAPQGSAAWLILSLIFGLLSGLAYLLGFAPPTWIRRAWLEPEIRAFLRMAVLLPQRSDFTGIVAELEAGTGRALGAAGAIILLWNASAERLEPIAGPLGRPKPIEDKRDGPPSASTVGESIAKVGAAVFRTGKPRFVDSVARPGDPAPNLTAPDDGLSFLAAPIAAGSKGLGAVLVYGSRPSLFVDDDLALLQLLADQTAIILQSRALADEAARVQAREETARLKDDFFSAAAHDLRTPLTALLSQIQLLRRRAALRPDAPADPRGLERVETETQRLIRLVNELLDVSRADQGRLLGQRQSIDLVTLARDLTARPRSELHLITVRADGPVIGTYDVARIEQVVENLVENAIKYSPEGGAIRIRAWQTADEAHLSVEDEGIGIPASEIPHLFERFYRAANVDDRKYAGLGLGLFICRSIVEAHGGHIDVTSDLGKGTTVHIALPREGE